MHTNDGKDTYHRVYFDIEKYIAFRDRYMEALANKEEIFTFNNREYVTLYAKYLLDYLRTALEIEL